MLVIRLSRTGRKKYPTYRIVAADSKRAATGKFVMILGHYNPHTKELVIKKDETERYLQNGAQPSNSVIKLLKQEKVSLPEWVSPKTRNRPPKKEVQAAPATAPEAKTDAVEAVATEAEASAPEASVAQVASEQADAVAENAQPKDKAETAEDISEQTEAVEASNDAAAEAASETPAK